MLLPYRLLLGERSVEIADVGLDDIGEVAIAKATDPVRMAEAFATAVKAGRLGYEGGLMIQRDMAVPSTPVSGTPFFDLD